MYRRGAPNSPNFLTIYLSTNSTKSIHSYLSFTPFASYIRKMRQASLFVRIRLSSETSNWNISYELNPACLDSILDIIDCIEYMEYLGSYSSKTIYRLIFSAMIRFDCICRTPRLYNLYPQIRPVNKRQSLTLFLPEILYYFKHTSILELYYFISFDEQVSLHLPFSIHCSSKHNFFTGLSPA